MGASFDNIRALRPGTFKIVISPACERIEKNLLHRAPLSLNGEKWV